MAARNPNFTGRDDALAAVAGDLSSRSMVTVHSVRGLGGVGKTQLAIEYAYTHASDYELVWSITAEDPTTIPDQFAALARKLGLTPAADPDEVREQVHDALRAAAGWLLIFDNADTVPGIQPWLPSISLPVGTPGHVIVTTRRGGFASLGHVLDLDVLDLPAAVRLLRARVPTLDQDIAEQLANQLDRLPLGLEQAAAYLDRTHTPADEYLHLLRTAPRAMLAEGVVHAHGASLATVWNLSLDRITREAPAAMDLLDICAYLAPEAIPLDLFTLHPTETPPTPSPSRHQPGRLQRDHRRPGRLLPRQTHPRRPPTPPTRPSRSPPPPPQPRDHHPHGEPVTTTNPPDTPRTPPTPAQVALRLLRVDAPGTIMGAPEDWPRWAVLLPHVLAALDHIETNAPVVDGYDDTTSEMVSWLLDCAGTYLQVHGRAREARPLLQRALAIAEASHGPDHRTIATHLNNLAGILRVLGQPATARPLAERALAITEATYGPDAPRTIMGAPEDWPRWAVLLPHVLAALDHIETNAPVIDGYDDATSTMVSWLLDRTGTYLHVHGRGREARPLLQQALVIDEATYGPDHPTVATRLNNLAQIVRDLGEPATAGPLTERALAITEATYGPNHPTVATDPEQPRPDRARSRRASRRPAPGRTGPGHHRSRLRTQPSRHPSYMREPSTLDP